MPYRWASNVAAILCRILIPEASARRFFESLSFAAFRIEVLRILGVRSFPCGQALQRPAQRLSPRAAARGGGRTAQGRAQRDALAAPEGGLGKILGDGQDVGLRHVEGDRFDLRSRRTQAAPEGIQGVGAFAVADEDDGAALEIEHHGEVAMSFADGDLVDGQQTQVLELGLRETLLQVPFLYVLDGVPADAEVLGHVLDGHVLGQAKSVAFEGMRVAATRIGEVDGDLANEMARVAFDAWDREEQMSRSVADRQAAKEPRLAAMTGEPVRTAGGAAETIAVLFDREHDFALEVIGAGITVAANAEAVIE
jgi:hypothetical protein